MIFRLIVILISLYSVAQAGVRVGNGGDAIVCYSDSSLNTRTSIEMFDYWEHQQVSSIYGLLDLGSPQLSVQEKITKAAQRIARFDPRLSQEISTIAFSIAKEINSFLVTQDVIPEITDANPKVMPNNTNCFLTQFAIQWQNTDDGIRRFYISHDLFTDSLTSNDTRAGLILHEAIYRYAIMNGATNSDGVRFFNYVAATSYYALARLDDYVNILNISKMNYRQCNRLNELFAQDLYVDANQRSCFANSLKLNMNLKLFYNDTQFYYEPSIQAVRSLDKNFDLLSYRDGQFRPLQNKFEQFELRKNLLTLNFNKRPNTAVNILDFKFNTKTLSQIQCINKMTYDLELASVIECEIQPHFIQLPTGNVFTAWRRIFYDGTSMIFNFQQPAFVEMNVPSRKKLLVDPNFPAVFDMNGRLIKAIALNELTYNKNGVIGRTNEFELIDGKLEFRISEKIEPQYSGLKIIASHVTSEALKICKFKSDDFTYAVSKFQRQYISTPEKVYDLDQDKVIFISDTHANVLETLTCSGDFLVDAKDL